MVLTTGNILSLHNFWELLLDVVNVDAFLASEGNSSQSRRAATLSVRSPNFRLVHRTTRSPLEADCSWVCRWSPEAGWSMSDVWLCITSNWLIHQRAEFELVQLVPELVASVAQLTWSYNFYFIYTYTSTIMPLPMVTSASAKRLHSVVFHLNTRFRRANLSADGCNTSRQRRNKKIGGFYQISRLRYGH